MSRRFAIRTSLVAVAAGAVFAAGSSASSPNAAQHARAALAPYSVAHDGVMVGSGVNAVATVVSPGHANKSIVKIRVWGLMPGHDYGVHVHNGTCTSYLGHRRYDPAGPGTRANEIWLDLHASPTGRAHDRVRVARFDPTGLSIVIHESANPDRVVDPMGHPGNRIACGDFTVG